VPVSRGDLNNFEGVGRMKPGRGYLVNIMGWKREELKVEQAGGSGFDKLLKALRKEINGYPSVMG